MIRMDETREVKKIFDNKSNGRRMVGRSRLRWLEDVEEDLRILNVKK